MPTYTKLFTSIVTSTIWTEDDQTRLVWVTMLAMADKNGEVHASIPGLARMANVSVESAERAIQILLAPDPYSRTKAADGRRIEEIQGGWFLINHPEYRQMASREDQKEANAERQRRFRERKKEAKNKGSQKSPPVTPRNGGVTQDLHIADTEAEKSIVRSNDRTRPAGPDWSLLAIWNEAPKKSRERSSKRQVDTEWRRIPKKDRPTIEETVAALKAWKGSEKWSEGYAEGLHLWIRNRQWENIPEDSPVIGPGFATRRRKTPSATEPREGEVDASEALRILGKEDA